MNGHTQDVLDYLGAPIPDEEEWLSYECKLNRRTKTAPQIRPKEWCGGCDRAKVRPGQKCPVCGVRMFTTHHKK